QKVHVFVPKSPRVRTKKSTCSYQKVHLGASKSPPWRFKKSTLAHLVGDGQFRVVVYAVENKN
ncbi:MAG: hypothetical protein L0I10_10855, partial [Bifidobacterium crudilactis]|nr:hypothetical protein [Bifidobacterium crudilactis]